MEEEKFTAAENILLFRILFFLIFQIYDRPADIRIMIACVVAIAGAKVDEPLGI